MLVQCIVRAEGNRRSNGLSIDWPLSVEADGRLNGAVCSSLSPLRMAPGEGSSRSQALGFIPGLV